MHISIILPCYNPPEHWAANIIEHWSQLFKSIEGEAELILVQDGKSNNVSDADIRLITDAIPNFRFVKYDTNKGKGYAIRHGVARASGDIIIYTDIDFPYTSDSIQRIYNALRDTETGIAIGVKDENYYDKIPASRRKISKILRWMIRVCFSIPVSDTQCGLKGFRGKAKQVFLDTTINRYLFDLEFIHRASKKGYDIKPIPVALNDGVTFRKVNYRILIPETINFIKLLFK